MRRAGRRLLVATAFVGSGLTASAEGPTPPSTLPETPEAQPDTSRIAAPRNPAAPADTAGATPDLDRSIFRHLRRQSGSEPRESVPRAGPAREVERSAGPVSATSPGRDSLRVVPRTATKPEAADSLHAGAAADSSTGGAADSRAPVAADSRAGGAADSLGYAVADSLAGAARDSLAGGGERARLEGRPAPLRTFRRSWGDRAVDRTARELWPWTAPLRTIESGNAFTPDLLGWGDLPGREPITVSTNGVPIPPPGMPEAAPDAFAPSWIESIELRQPSPVRLPNNPTGGPLADVTWIRPDSAVTVSGARLSDGSADSNTDEFYFARPGPRSLFHLLWADHKTGGRLLYGPGEGSEIVFRYEHDIPGGTVAIGAEHQFARQRLVDGAGLLRRRWLWDRDAYVLAYDGTISGWELDLDVAASWHRHGWEGEEPAPARRKDGVVQAIARVVGPGRSLWPLASVQVDRDRLRYWEPGALSLDETDVGLGFAAGMGGTSRFGRYEISAGRSDPGLGDAGLVWAAEGDAEFSGWEAQVYVGRTRRPLLLPRLGNHLYLQVAQAIRTLPYQEEGAGETLDRAEIWFRRPTGRGLLAVGVRAVRIEGAVSAESVGLARLTPAGLLLGPLPEDAVDQTVSALALHVEFERALRWGFSVRADGAVRTSDPGHEHELWMTPAELRGRLGWRARLFDEALDLDIFLRGQWSGERTSTIGLLPASDRYDGGATVQVDALSLWFLIVNLEDDATAAATVDGGSMILPIRSFRMGLTWRFLD